MSGMAGILLLYPLSAGFCAAPVLVLAMRSVGLSVGARIGVDFTVMISAFIVPYIPGFTTPPAKRDANGLYQIVDMLWPIGLLSTGAFALLDGLILDVVIAAGSSVLRAMH